MWLGVSRSWLPVKHLLVSIVIARVLIAKYFLAGCVRLPVPILWQGPAAGRRDPVHRARRVLLPRNDHAFALVCAGGAFMLRLQPCLNKVVHDTRREVIQAVWEHGQDESNV